MESHSCSCTVTESVQKLCICKSGGENLWSVARTCYRRYTCTYLPGTACVFVANNEAEILGRKGNSSGENIAMTSAFEIDRHLSTPSSSVEALLT